MAKIYKISGYLIDANNYYAQYEIQNFLEGEEYPNCMEELYGQHIHVEEKEFEWDDDLPLNQKNCYLAELEKYFPMEDTPAEYDRELPRPGELWKHFKGKTVEIVGLGRCSENPNNYMVAYNCTNGIMYFRPLDMFMSEVDRDKYPDVEQKYRFEKVEEDGIELIGGCTEQ